ncbi:MAG: MinD/ParA family protein [Thermodesulfobacteriota bacterium]|nr:MinD/ParA family protein [Thermodesulfobacteriota bacterium]
MEHRKSSDKVISLAKRRSIKGASLQSNRGLHEAGTRVIAVTSGKGGVGKTNIVANLGFALSKMGKKVLMLDADLGLGNIDILLGMVPKYNLAHVLTGAKTISQIIIEGPGNMKILPASSGIQEITHLAKSQQVEILTDLDLLIDDVDVLLIDTGAGISSNVMYFNATAQEILVVATQEPTSMTDAYALMKVLSLDYEETHFKLVVNMAGNSQEARETFRQLNLVAERFLDISIEYMGHILFDKNITKAVKRQKLVTELYPESDASLCFTSLAKDLYDSAPQNVPVGGTHFFWKHLLENSMK